MINKIVITGGPCGGKSTALATIQKEFEALGYRVITISETATELINSGITMKEVGVVSFQKSILNMQLCKEKNITDCAEKLLSENEKILIVCDRGAMDTKAYATDSEYDEILSDLGESIVNLRDRYDAVFHLVTAADGVVEHYTLSNNTARTETPEEAIDCDRKLISAWCGHPHLRVIDNSTDFDGKIKRLIKEIKSFLGEPKPLEIERKYLIKYPDINVLENSPFCKGVDIQQIYYVDSEGKRLRVRKRGENGEYVYFKTEKRQITPTVRIEIESKISKDEYISILDNKDNITGIIEKRRYCLVYAGQYFEIDVYPFWDDKAIMEIELCDENEAIVFPDYIEIVKDVTDDINYRNSSLANKRF